MSDKNYAGFFSPYRWSPGSIIILTILSIMNVLLIFGSLYYHSIILFSSFIIGLAIELLIIFIKGFENLVIMENEEFNYEGSYGTVLKEIIPGKEGVVKIKNELWSARSDETIKKGEVVKIIKKEGLYLIVKREKN
ncbi:MAG: NfeD family protein [Thermoplasmata archaeon]|nr:NfeD family protein [Thermoplasmata archaeon]